MKCEGCGNQYAARVRIGYHEGKKWEICDQCGASPVWLPDVFLGGHGGQERTDENLCGNDGKPIPFSTKREKAAIMRMLNVRQADSAEHNHGYRNESHLNVGKKKYFL